MPSRPPKLALRFFRWFCIPELVEDIEGDLIERFKLRATKRGQQAAKRLFIRDVFQLFRPGIIRSFTGTQKLNSQGMAKNNFIIAKRQLFRNKMYSTIKIGGFAIGIAVCMLIALFIRDELSYDRHISDSQNMFMVVKEYHENGDIEKYTWFAPPFANAILEDFPEVTNTGRMLFGEGFGAGHANIRKAGEMRNYYDDGFAYADQSILEIFNFPMVYGNLQEALSKPQSMVLTKSKAEMLFPGINPVGEVIFIDDNTERPYTIGGVIDDLPKSSTVKFNYLWSLKDREFWSGEQGSWGSNNYQVFVKLKPGTDLDNLNPRLKEIGQKYILPTYKRAGYADAEEIVNSIHFSLLPITDLHLFSADVNDPFIKSDIKYVLIFGLIALFILGLACINFINLSTAKSANRAKEVGLRKTIGSTRGNLIGQFLTESVLYSLLSFILAIGLATLLLPYFNQIAQKSIVLPWNTYWFIPTLLVLSMMVGIAAGLYPAFYLSAFRPASVLKGNLSMGSKSSRLRNILVVLQFTASIILIIGTFVVYQQMSFILNRKVGFDKDQVVLLQSPYLLNNNLESFRAALSAIPEVKSISYSGYLPVSGSTRNGNTWWNEGKIQTDAGISGQNWMVDHHYIETLGIELVKGRNFSEELSSDSSAMVINERMAKALGIAEDPIGKKITNGDDYTVIGVVADFNYESLTEPLQPLAMRLGNNNTTAAIKLNTQQVPTTLNKVRQTWESMAPNQPFIYEFLDQRFAGMYAGVKRIRNILTSFAILAVVIACLGLFGLSVFMVEQRNKEISVRLVLGARVAQIVSMLSFNFLKPILLALVLAIPVAWYVMQEWLNGFEDTPGLSPQLFLLAGTAAIFIALITISFQSLKAAYSNPVNGLRNE